VNSAESGEDRGKYDVLVVGGGPAGLSAALVLGRCCRRVLLCDAGAPRNTGTRGVHGFLSRDGTTTAELRRIGREQLRPYDNVELRDTQVWAVRTEPGPVGDGFVISMRDGTEAFGRKLLLATGVVDDLPPIAGLSERWGNSVLPCPYCDGWELRGQRLGVLGRGPDALALTRSLTCWTQHVTLFTNGPTDLTDDEEHSLMCNGVQLAREPVRALTGPGTSLTYVELEGAPPIPCEGLFVSAGQRQKSPLVTALGCTVNASGRVITGEHESTNIPGLYVAGDASGNVELAIVAAAEGAEAAFAINRSLVREDFALRTVRARVQQTQNATASPPG
jgi:thioredoxin reductase